MLRAEANERIDVPPLVLASASPRRKALLADAGFSFEVRPSSVDETRAAGEAPLQYAMRLAIEKTLEVACEIPRRSIFLGADTIVVNDGVVYGKPRDAEDAVRILEQLVGRNHYVVTAWTLLCNDAPDIGRSGFSRSIVRMREASASEIRAYVESGEPMDKAGACAAQGRGRHLVAAILGPLDNVIGLPVAPVVRALAEYGIVPRVGDGA